MELIDHSKCTVKNLEFMFHLGSCSKACKKLKNQVLSMMVARLWIRWASFIVVIVLSCASSRLRNIEHVALNLSRTDSDMHPEPMAKASGRRLKLLNNFAAHSSNASTQTTQSDDGHRRHQNLSVSKGSVFGIHRASNISTVSMQTSSENRMKAASSINVKAPRLMLIGNASVDKSDFHFSRQSGRCRGSLLPYICFHWGILMVLFVFIVVTRSDG